MSIYVHDSLENENQHLPLDTLTAIDLAKLRVIVLDEISHYLRPDVADVTVERVINRIIATAAPSVKGD